MKKIQNAGIIYHEPTREPDEKTAKALKKIIKLIKKNFHWEHYENYYNTFTWSDLSEKQVNLL